MSLDIHLISDDGEYLYDANVTHNLNAMADAAGFYQCVWRPDENGITTANQLVDPLVAGIRLLVAEPDRFKALNPQNGWGCYDNFVNWLLDLLCACLQHPKATVEVSR